MANQVNDDAGKCDDNVRVLMEFDGEMECDSSPARDQQTAAAPTEDITAGPVLLDVQLLETTSGYRIKELAYKVPFEYAAAATNHWPPTDMGFQYTCFRHDPKYVRPHRTINLYGRVYDRYTGLEISCGEEDYSDQQIVAKLQWFNVVFVKGHNKKRALDELFARCAHMTPQQTPPRVVNVDASTVGNDDFEFFQINGMSTARFSFKHVYRNFAQYLQLLCKSNPCSPANQPIYLNNAIATDRRFNIFARGRSLWICPHDHKCGRNLFSSQRCAALNLGLLETLWCTGREKEYNNIVKRSRLRAASLWTCRNENTHFYLTTPRRRVVRHEMSAPHNFGYWRSPRTVRAPTKYAKYNYPRTFY